MTSDTIGRKAGPTHIVALRDDPVIRAALAADQEAFLAAARAASRACKSHEACAAHYRARGAREEMVALHEAAAKQWRNSALMALRQSHGLSK